MVRVVDSIRQLFNKRQATKSLVPPVDIPEPFHFAGDIGAVHTYFSAFKEAQTVLPKSQQSLRGSCFICKSDVDFRIDVPGDGSAVNWRETLVCPQCQLINRWRSCLHVFEAICQPGKDDSIYLTETLSPVYQNLAARFPSLIASEYFPDSGFGEQVRTAAMPVRNEDVTQLTFADSMFQHVLCFDVLEHVPDYRAALREFYRVLKAGGTLVLSVPFSFQHATNIRARLDETGKIEHLSEPCYHGDPLSADGVLSYYDFGMELLDEMRAAGFEACFLLCYFSRHWGYLNENVVFIARRSGLKAGG